MSDQQYLFLVRALLSISLTPGELAALRQASGAITVTNVTDHPFPDAATDEDGQGWYHHHGSEGDEFDGQLGFVVAVATATTAADAGTGLGNLVREALGREWIVESVAVRRLTAYGPRADEA